MKAQDVTETLDLALQAFGPDNTRHSHSALWLC